jgi:hypothetical protein
MTGIEPLPTPPPIGTARPISSSYAPIADAPAAVVPWEHNEGTWLRRWWDTLVMAMFRPNTFFIAVRDGRRVGPAIWFFCIGLAINCLIAPLVTAPFEGSILSCAWNSLSEKLPHPAGFDGINEDGELDLSRILPTGLPPGSAGRSNTGSTPGPIDPESISAALSGLSAVLQVFSILAGIMFGFVSLFATAALFQAAAWVFIPRRRPFAYTLRTVAYAHAPLVCSLVPLVGTPIFLVWLSVLIIMGLRIVHQTTRTRVVAALTFWPTLILLTVGLACSLAVRQLLSAANL